jgi:exosortase/archaeosortase family protein
MKRNRVQKRLLEEKAAKSSGHTISIRNFAITYIMLMGVFFLLIKFVPLQKIIDLNGLYTSGVVFITSKVLGIISIPCTYHGSIIQLPSISLDIKFGCNGLEAVMIFSVAVIAFPSSWKSKLLGIISGFIVIQVINIVRIAGLAYSGIHFKSLFEYVHIYIAQGMMVAISLGLFFVYIYYAKTTEKTIS